MVIVQGVSEENKGRDQIARCVTYACSTAVRPDTAEKLTGIRGDGWYLNMPFTDRKVPGVVGHDVVCS